MNTFIVSLIAIVNGCLSDFAYIADLLFGFVYNIVHVSKILKIYLWICVNEHLLSICVDERLLSICVNEHLLWICVGVH